MAVRWSCAALVLASACGRLGYDAAVDAGDAVDLADAADAPAPIDAAATCTRACGPCTPRGFGDDFDDGTVGDAWGQVVPTGSSIVEAGGLVTLTAAIEADAWLETVLTYDLATQPAIVHLTDIGAAPPTAELCLAARDDAFEFASICVEAGGAELAFDVPGVPSHVMAFTPATMSWWRLGRVGDAFHFATSADGVTWTADVVLAPVTALAALTYVRIGAGNFSGPATTAVARFDGFRLGGPPDNLLGQAVGCAPAGWSDDFADGLVPAWEVVADVGAIAEEAGGVARLAPPAAAGQTGSAEFFGRSTFDGRGSAVEVQLAATLAGGDAGSWFELLHLGGGDGVGFYLEPPTLYAISRVAYSPTGVASVPYDPVAHRHLRIRHAGATVTWETSPDGATWSALHAATGLFDPRAIVVDLGAEKYNGVATGDVRFDDLTLGP